MRELDYNALSKEELAGMIKDNSKFFLALEGFWFQAAVELCGYETAVAIDIKTWEGYFPFEARYLRKRLGITGNTIPDIIETLKHSAFAPGVTHRIRSSDEKGVFAVYDSPALEAIEKAGRDRFASEPVGTVAFNKYAQSINPAVKVSFKPAPPPKSAEELLGEWEFTLQESSGEKEMKAGRGLDLTVYSKEQLVELLKAHSRLFLALDGIWFLAAEEICDYKTALEIDTKAWEFYFPYEADFIRGKYGIKGNSIPEIIESLKYCAFVPCMIHEIPEVTQERGVFGLYECPSLIAMEKAGRTEFTCEPVGTIVFNKYARHINPKAKVRFLAGPPRKSPQDVCCQWEFTLEE